MTNQLLGVDEAWSKANPKHLRDAGYRLVARYLSPDASKNLSATERDALLKAGEDIVVVWESTAARALDGAAAGREDAQRAVRQLKALRGPKGMAIYAGVDTDTSGSKVAPYFRGFREVVRAAGYIAGVYGSYSVVNYLIHEGLVDVAWQTVAWSGGKVSAHADLYQRETGVRVDGASVDIDVICHPGYGGWQAALPATHPAAKAHRVKVTDMTKRREQAARDLAEGLGQRKHAPTSRAARLLKRLRRAIDKVLSDDRGDATVDTLVRSLARTVIPYVVGLIVSTALHVGLNLHGHEAQVAVGVGTAYYALVRLAETKLSPVFGVLLGSTSTPQYQPKRRKKSRKAS